MNKSPVVKRPHSRRNFLATAAAVLAGGVALGLFVGKPVLSKLVSRKAHPVFPKDSIFEPAEEIKVKI